MKITDRMKALQGVTDAYWCGKKNKLTVYYDPAVPLDIIKVRVAASLRDAELQDSIDDITLISQGLVNESADLIKR
jgi:hypothetical protein